MRVFWWNCGQVTWSTMRTIQFLQNVATYIGGAKAIFFYSKNNIIKFLCSHCFLINKKKKKSLLDVFTLFLMNFLYYFNQIAKNIDGLMLSVL